MFAWHITPLLDTPPGSIQGNFPEEHVYQDEIQLILYGGIVLLSVFASVILFVLLTYRKKQVEHFREKELDQKQFESAQLQSQIEIKEQTLEYLAQEIHDNVSHRLTLAAIHINTLECTDEELRNTTSELIDKALHDLRDLSKSLSGNYILEKGIELALEREAELISASKKIRCDFSCTGEHHGLNDQQEILLFRCAQEALNNAVKHSEGNQLAIRMEQTREHISVHIEDNGKGMDITNVQQGVGVRSIQQRITLLNGTFTFEAKKGGGTVVKFEVPAL